MAELHFTPNGYAAFLGAIATLLNEYVPLSDHEKRSHKLSNLVHQYVEQSIQLGGDQLSDDDLKCLYGLRDAFQKIFEHPDFFPSRTPH